MVFWLFCREVVKVEVLGFFRDFHEGGRFVKSLNVSFLVLVPKKGGAEDLKDFRPISLRSCWPRCWLINLKRYWAK